MGNEPNILAIHASERQAGNTDGLLRRAAAGAEAGGAKVRRINVRGMHFSPCIACEGCYETGVCVLKDDMTDVYPLLTEADHVIVAAPIYFMSVPGRFKCFIDRCQAMWFARKISPHLVARNPSGLKRVGAFISCCGYSGGEIMFPPAAKAVAAFFKSLEIEMRHTLYVPDTDAHPASESPDTLGQAERIGAILAGLTETARPPL